MQAADGDFYGTSLSGGSTTGGTLFRYSSGGGFGLLHTFNGPDGTAPSGPMVEATDGNLYGTAQTTSGFCCGTIVQRTPSGNLGRVFAFPGGGAEGSNPMGGLIQGADGRLYGTTFSGGTAGPNGGIAYAHVLPPSILSLVPSSGPAAGGTLKTIGGTTFVDGATVEVGGVAATGVTFVGPTQLTGAAPALAPGTLNDVKVTNPDTSYTTLKQGWFADFLDVPQTDIFHNLVEDVFRRGITAGCSGGNYCRNDIVKRKQMAVFLLKARFGASHIPPPATGTVFTDVTNPADRSIRGSRSSRPCRSPEAAAAAPSVRRTRCGETRWRSFCSRPRRARGTCRPTARASSTTSRARASSRTGSKSSTTAK